MKRRNLFIIAFLLLTVITIGTVSLFVYDVPGHIACVTYILSAVAFGMIFGFLAESANYPKHSRNQPSGTKPSNPTKRKLNDAPTSVLYENGERDVTEHTGERNKTKNWADITQGIDYQVHESEEDVKTSNTEVMPKQNE